MRLQYEISADASQLKRVLRSVESEAKASNRRIGREQAASVYGPGRKEASAARRFEEQEARALNRAKLSLDRQRHNALMTQYRAEERERLRADKNVTDSAIRLEKTRIRARQQAERDFKRLRERTAERISGGAARAIGGGIGHAARLATEVAAVAGGFGVAEALSDRIAVQRKASILANQSEAPEAKGAIAQEAMGVRGFKGEEALDFLTNFHEKSGDLGAARGAMQNMAQLALATGTNFEELGSAAGSAFTVIRDQIKNPQERLDVLNDVMTTIAQQGSMGAIEMRNLVEGMGELGGATRSFEGGPARILKSMGGLAQVALQRGGAGSPEEAITSVARFATDIPEHAKHFAKEGINVWADKGHTQLRAPEQILGDMLAKTGGNLEKMGDLFGIRAQKVARGFSPLFGIAERENAALPASQRQAKGVAGRAAVLAEFEKFAGATRSAEELKAQASSRLEDPDIQIKEAVKTFNNAVGENLVPVVREVATTFANLTPVIASGSRALARFVDFSLQHPFEGLGAIVGVSVAKDIGAELAKAGIEKTIQAALSGSLLGTGGLVIGSMVASVAAAKLVIDAINFDAQKAVGGAVASGNDVRARAAAELEKNGTLSEGTRKELMQLSATEQGSLAKGEAYLSSNEGFGSFLSRAFAQVTGGKHNLSEAARLGETAASAEYRKGATETKALLEVDAAGKRFGDAASKQLLETLKNAKIVVGPEASRVAPINSPSRG